MFMRGEKYSREETLLAFELYCTIPSGKVTIQNPHVIALAEAIDRPVNSVKLKLQNFKAYDPSYTQDGRVGMAHGSRLDEEVCRELLQNWDSLIAETNEIKNQLGLTQFKEITNENESSVIYIGGNRAATTTQRIGQLFFRKALLASYNNRCCFTGIAIPELLRASHIKAWSDSNDINEKTNPQNGLLLNALHDVAFDKGYTTITTDYRIVVSHVLLESNDANQRYFAQLNGQKMILPYRFLPDKQFVLHHNNKFKGELL